ncbi:MAG: peptidylprolyl isomerase, partial [Aridibacter famidurans]|nr:peptidylprolyl isomerase [Aridibacter famidurans]
VSQEQWDKQLKDSGTSEEELKLSLKKEMAINKLIEKITGKIEPPKDSEIEAFYNGNKEAFKARRGAQFAAIVIDPNKVFEGDTTTNEVEAQQRAKELGDRLLGRRADFATIAREFSEDPQTRARGGDWRYFTEQEMAQTFGQNFANYVMNEAQNGDIIPQAIPLEGKILILKVQQKKEKDEDQTLETPGVREQITKALIDSRKQLLSESYAAVAMSEAKIENFLARKVIENPNELSGARPAGQDQPANTNAAPVNANVENTNADSNAAANAGESNSNAASNASESESN